MVRIEVNSRTIEALKGQTILEALINNGIQVPTLCSLPELSPTGACRMCVVEVEGMDKLVPACSFPVKEKMKIKTHSGRVLQARKMNVELLLSSHPDDCLYCERNGNCELQKLAEDLNVRSRNISGERRGYKIDGSSSSIIRDPSKCILCGRCVRICEEIAGVAAIDFGRRGDRLKIVTAMNEPLDFSSCIDCGMCLLSCPTGALADKTSLQELDRPLDDPATKVAVQYTPEVVVSLADEFGIRTGTDMQGIINSVLRRIGFDYVFETSSGAEIAVMEQSNAFLERYGKNDHRPLILSRCPAWVNYVEKFRPELLSYMVPVRSPHQIIGRLIKGWFAEENSIPVNRICSVLITNCSAAKHEASREEYYSDNVPDIDYVLTTREFARLIRLHGINIHELEHEDTDEPFQAKGSAGKLFSVAGGELEATLRTLYRHFNGKELPDPRLGKLRKSGGIREESIVVPGGEIKAVAISGLGNAAEIAKLIADKEYNFDIIEVMACGGGCINGGGQPIPGDPERLKARIKTIYDADKNSGIRTAHGNTAVNGLYDSLGFLPGSEESRNKFFTHIKAVKVLK